jgi:hypothetical protein
VTLELTKNREILTRNRANGYLPKKMVHLMTEKAEIIVRELSHREASTIPTTRYFKGWP